MATLWLSIRPVSHTSQPAHLSHLPNLTSLSCLDDCGTRSVMFLVPPFFSVGQLVRLTERLLQRCGGTALGFSKLISPTQLSRQRSRVFVFADCVQQTSAPWFFSHFTTLLCSPCTQDILFAQGVRLAAVAGSAQFARIRCH